MTLDLLADAVLLLHLTYIVFVVLGGALLFERPRIAWFHVPAVLWAVWVECTAGTCPLTPIENALRRAAGQAGYTGGFVEHYLAPVIYPDGLTTAIQTLLGVIVLVVNLGFYALAARKRFKRERA